MILLSVQSGNINSANMNRLVELQREYQFSLLDVGWTGLKLSAGVFAVAAVGEYLCCTLVALQGRSAAYVRSDLLDLPQRGFLVKLVSERSMDRWASG
jgi:hypothetical protein